jgi:uncharacterized protein (UPF0332 family)
MTLTPEVKAYLAKAHHALEVARKLQLGKDFSDAAGKAYYAMFYGGRGQGFGRKNQGIPD